MPYDSIFSPDLFKGSTIIVTGGGSGIGRCNAHELSGLGAHVVIMGRDEEKLSTVRDEIVSDGGMATYVVCDIRKEENVKDAVQRVLCDNGRIDGLVNNAGGQFRASLRDISTKGFEAVVRNNLTGGFIFMREVYTQWMAGIRPFGCSAQRNVEPHRNRSIRMVCIWSPGQRRRARCCGFKRI